MGLDIYVGSLTRYHTGDWETVVQQAAQLMGLEVHTVRPPTAERPVTDTEAIREVVTLWMQALGKGIEPHLGGTPCAWEEDPLSAYFTDKPAWDCFGSLLLWAAHAEHPELEPAGAFVERWFEAPALVASNAEGFDSQFNQLLRSGLELWLPVDFPFTFEAEDVTGRQIGIGSSPALRRQLEWLNQITWQADEETIRGWRKHCPEHRSPVEEGARFAFEILWRLSRHAVEERLPMKLDH
ncbi:hypothetical protein JXA47_00490 [Candidatus Sumerlaeota bacterium]|nr:hypothetical protein [Candidatus Sumerlaeota bacterium]